MSKPDPGEGPVSKLFFKYYTPALVSMLSITLHQIINGIILGQKVGKEGVAAVGLYGPLITILIALSLPVMIGGGILVGKSIGAKNYSHVQQIFDFATTLGIISGSIVAIITPFILQPLAGFLAGSDHKILIDNTAGYLFWQLITMPFFFLRMFWGNFISTAGAPKISRNASLIAVTINIVLDLLLIIVLHMGVEGASIATAVAICCGVLYQAAYIFSGKTYFNFRAFRLTFKFQERKELLKLGFPSFISELAFSTGLLIINKWTIPYGAQAIAAFGIVNYLSFIFIRLFTSAMIAALPIMSYNIGAGQPKRVLATLKFALSFTAMLGLVISSIGFVMPGSLVRLFSGSDATFIGVATNAVSLYFILFIAAGPNYILSAYLQTIGKTITSAIMNVLKGAVMIIFLLWALSDFGLNGIWLSRSLAEVLTFLLVGAYLLLRKTHYSVIRK